MKTATLNRVWQLASRTQVLRAGIAITIAFIWFLSANHLLAGATVNWISGGINNGYPNGYGNADGDITLDAEYHTPCGLVMDSSGNNLYVADRDNNAVRILAFDLNWTFHLVPQDQSGNYLTNLFRKPVGLAFDSAGNLFVLNRGNNSDGTVYKISNAGILVATNLSRLTNAAGIAVDFSGNIYVTASNRVFKVTPAGVSNVVATIPGASLQGIAIKPTTGLLAVCDSAQNGIYLINPTNGVVTTNAGFHGTGDFFYSSNVDPSNTAKFFQPSGIAAAGDGTLIVADYGNNRVKAVLANGVVTNLYGVASSYWYGPYPGFQDGTVKIHDAQSPVQARQPNGVTIAQDGTVYVTEDYYHIIRKMTGAGLIPPPLPPPPPPAAPNILTITASYVTLNNGQVNLTWASAPTATNYIIKRSQTSGTESPIATTGTATSYTDTTVINGNTYYYVISAVNAGGEGPNSAEVSITVPLPPVPDPQIGYVEFPPSLFTSVFHPISASGVTFNNDKPIVIIGATGSQTFYNYSNTPVAANVPDPTPASASAPVGYVDGLYSVAGYTVAQILPTLSIKAIGMQAGHSNSAVVSALIQFITANPVINDIGNGAGGFNISDITAGARLYYTLDGSDPSTNNYAANGDLGVALSSNQWLNVTFPITSNTLFKVRAFKDNYQPSAVVSNLFTVAGTRYTTITFGKPFGEPHSAFVTRPGQYFYAPVTLQLVPGFGKMYSLQFNVAVTNGFTNILNGGAIPPILNGDGIDFRSMLMTQVDPAEGLYFPPADGQWYLPIPNLTGYVTLGATNLTSTIFLNTNNNLIGVGWLFRTGFKYKYSTTNVPPIVYLDFDTAKQDLISYSIGHDTLFSKGGGTVLAGAYSFRVPTNANIGDQYFIQLGSPSATADGVGAPGASITIAPPDLSQAVTVGAPAYLVGDAAPFHWFNAGDFGNNNLDNSDVMQVYQSAIELVNMPPLNSDLYLAMDSSGGFGVWDGVNGYYTNSGTASLIAQQAMWDGNDLTINTNAFGDGWLDINDLYVTFRRSLDPSLTWYIRYWTNNQFVAVTTPNLAYNSNSPHLSSHAAVSAKVSSTNDYRQSTINFSAGDAVVTANQTIQIPINAQIFGSYPLRVLGLSLTVVPLDGSPDITTPVTFTPAAGLGSPTIESPKGAASYAAAWLNSSISGLTGNAQIGTLTVTIPASATSLSAYAVHFNKASGSPNGLAVFPKQTLTGLVTLSSRTGSGYSDGIPDSWRLRWFGTTNNILSRSNACPTSDGISNWKKFVAGVDPNTANNFPSVNAKSPVPAGYTRSIHWPTVSGKQYVMERSTSLFAGDWTIIQTNTGTGTDMEFDDNVKGGTHFYRVRILP